MNLSQFEFKPSLSFGIKEEAKLKTDKETTIQIFKNDVYFHLVKKTLGRILYSVKFMNTEEGKIKLEKALKNISKRK